MSLKCLSFVKVLCTLKTCQTFIFSDELIAVTAVLKSKLKFTPRPTKCI